MIAIIDYGLGNLGSIKNMLKRIGASAEIISDPSKINDAEKLILPGVGSFDMGMNSLNEQGWTEVLNQKVLINKIPILGICLGMQLMTLSSEEGIEKGLGWVNAETIKFDINKYPALKIPHMGWNEVNIKNELTLFKNVEDIPKYYFVHSYYIKCAQPENIAATTHYGNEFVSSFQKDNVFGVQFHPEKSHKYGMRLLENFVKS